MSAWHATPNADRATRRRILEFALPHAWTIAGFLVLATISAALGVISPILAGRAVNAIVDGAGTGVVVGLAALIAVASQIAIPLAMVPINLALLAVFMTGFLLEKRWALTSVMVYLLIGAVGLPVFSGLRGGPQHLVGPTGGYLIGYLLSAGIVSALLYWRHTRRTEFPLLDPMLLVRHPQFRAAIIGGGSPDGVLVGPSGHALRVEVRCSSLPRPDLLPRAVALGAEHAILRGPGERAPGDGDADVRPAVRRHDAGRSGQQTPPFLRAGKRAGARARRVGGGADEISVRTDGVAARIPEPALDIPGGDRRARAVRRFGSVEPVVAGSGNGAPGDGDPLCIRAIRGAEPGRRRQCAPSRIGRAVAAGARARGIGRRAGGVGGRPPGADADRTGGRLTGRSHRRRSTGR